MPSDPCWLLAIELTLRGRILNMINTNVDRKMGTISRRAVLKGGALVGTAFALGRVGWALGLSRFLSQMCGLRTAL